ncbi:MAG TPA: response regulator [Terriglobales bacterium]|nr:response regulator [Terriglobales bacterium]
MSPGKKKPTARSKRARPKRPHADAEGVRQKRRETDKAYHQALIKIHYSAEGKVVETPVKTLGNYSPDFRMAVLLVEDKTSDADRCRAILHAMGYDGVQLITDLQQALEYLDDVLDKLTRPPDAIILDLGLGYDSGFDILRKCNAHPLLQKVPILVWTKQADEHTEAFSTYLGAKDYLVKSRDPLPLRKALTRVLVRG